MTKLTKIYRKRKIWECNQKNPCRYWFRCRFFKPMISTSKKFLMKMTIQRKMPIRIIYWKISQINSLQIKNFKTPKQIGVNSKIIIKPLREGIFYLLTCKFLMLKDDRKDSLLMPSVWQVHLMMPIRHKFCILFRSEIPFTYATETKKWALQIFVWCFIVILYYKIIFCLLFFTV